MANALPGDAVPYDMASGEGARYELNGQLVTVIARAVETGGIFSAAAFRRHGRGVARSYGRGVCTRRSTLRGILHVGCRAKAAF